MFAVCVSSAPREFFAGREIENEAEPEGDAMMAPYKSVEEAVPAEDEHEEGPTAEEYTDDRVEEEHNEDRDDGASVHFQPPISA